MVYIFRKIAYTKPIIFFLAVTNIRSQSSTAPSTKFNQQAEKGHQLSHIVIASK